MSTPKKKVAVLISGNGSNLQAILNRWQEGAGYEPVLVLSNKAGVKGLERAQKAGVPTLVIDHREFEGREAFDRAMDQALKEAGVELIALAGFMRLLSEWFVREWRGRLINVHPSLLPAFPGLHTHKKALEYGVRFSGCSVFFVDEGVDTGAIIAQAVVPVEHGDDEEALAKRVLRQEHVIFPQALEDLALGKVRLEGSRVIFTETRND